MGSKRISELTALETSEDDDIIAIVDISTGETKYQTKEDFLKDIVLAEYVRIIGDTMTGKLIISPTGDVSLDAQKNIVLKSGRKLIFDGE